jgi:hypothetical protein
LTSSVRLPGELLPYHETTDETYAQLAARSFTLEEPKAGTLILRGPCPRCHSIIDIPVVTSIFRSSRGIGGWRARQSSSKVARDHIEPMMCTCEDEHPNRPEGRYGCGAYWTLVISAERS